MHRPSFSPAFIGPGPLRCSGNVAHSAQLFIAQELTGDLSTFADSIARMLPDIRRNATSTLSAPASEASSSSGLAPSDRRNRKATSSRCQRYQMYALPSR